MKIGMVSLGCAKNRVDAELMLGVLAREGFELESDPEKADAIIVNTCGFIEAAKQESIDAILEMAEYKKKNCKALIVTGCLSKRYAKELPPELPEVDAFLGIGETDKIAQVVRACAAGAHIVEADAGFCYLENVDRVLTTPGYTAYVKIADGCNNRCSYCAIPGIRGALRSRSIASVETEAKNLVDAGVKELLVIAQDITAFGADRPGDGEDIARLLERLNAIPGDFVIRLLYTHPAHYTDSFIGFLARPGTKVLPYLDIPLQHINDRILKAMGRHVTKAETVALLERLREEVKDLTIRTTFITGFPGETDEEFEELAAFVKEQKFERCGVFPYSPEPGTPAAKLPGQIPLELAETRAKRLLELQKKIMRKVNRNWIGREVRMLVDDVDGRVAVGRAMMDAPEIDNRILLLHAKRLRPGQFCPVRITGADSYEFTAEQL